jgi:hypothetical protein
MPPVRYMTPDEETSTELRYTVAGGILVTNAPGVATYYAVEGGVIVASVPDVETYGVVTVGLE